MFSKDDEVYVHWVGEVHRTPAVVLVGSTQDGRSHKVGLAIGGTGQVYWFHEDKHLGNAHYYRDACGRCVEIYHGRHTSKERGGD